MTLRLYPVVDVYEQQVAVSRGVGLAGRRVGLKDGRHKVGGALGFVLRLVGQCEHGFACKGDGYRMPDELFDQFVEGGGRCPLDYAHLGA